MIHPSFGIFIKDLREKLSNIRITTNVDSFVYLEGNVEIKNLTVENTSAWICNNSEETL